jgi:hypothetical protein
VDAKTALPLLEKALKQGGSVYASEDIFDALLSGKMQAFYNDDATVITEIVQFPRARYLQVIICIGKLDAVMDLHPKVIDFAKANACKYMISSGRKGWTPFVKRKGWKHVWNGFRYDIEDGA